MSNATSTARLQAASTKLANLGEAAQVQLTKALARTGQALLTEEFERAVAPDGAPWKPVKSGRRPLQGRRRLARDLVVSPSSTGITVTARSIQSELFEAHNRGAYIPPRTAQPREMAINPRTGRFLAASRARRRKLIFVAQAPRSYKGWRLAQRQIMPDAVPAPWGERFNATGRDWMRAYLGAS